MAVALGYLESLLGLSFPTSDFTDVEPQSWTDIPGPDLGLDTITATTGDTPSPLGLGGTTLTIVGVNDRDSTLVADITGNGIGQLETLYVAGFAPNALLLSAQSLATLYLTIGIPNGSLGYSDDGILSTPAPLPADTPTEFDVYGTSNITPGPLVQYPSPLEPVTVGADDQFPSTDIGIRFAASDFTAATVQASTPSDSSPYGLASITVTDTGAPAPDIGNALEVDGFVSYPEQYGSVYLSSLQVQAGYYDKFWWVIGCSADGVLLSQQDPQSFAAALAGGSLSDADWNLAYMSFDPVASGSTISVDTSSTITLDAPTIPTFSVSAVYVVDPGAGTSVEVTPQPYTGPVSGLHQQYVNQDGNGLIVAATTPDCFILTGDGEQGIIVNSGTNVLDGGTNSTFMIGGSGTDSFYIDDRGDGADIWSTAVNFHAGDDATFWGVQAQDATLTWEDGVGAPGYTGLTLVVSQPGHATAAMTFSGYTSADLSDGRLVASGGIEPVSGLPYFTVHAAS